jgi:hypothetical protein
MLVSADGRDLGHAGAGGAGRLGDGACAKVLHGGKGLTAALMGNADEVDDIVGALDSPVNRPAHADIGLNRLDLADIASRLDIVLRGLDGAPRRGPGSRAWPAP